jgi:hypothetical protein
MVAYPKLESDQFSYIANVYVKPKNSKFFVDLKNNFAWFSESIAKIFINKHRYEYEWISAMLEPGDIIKYEIVKTYKIKNDFKNKRETKYFIVKKNNKFSDENPFPLVSGDVYEFTGDYNKIGDVADARIKNKIY